MTEATVNRKYKARIFEMIFSEKEALLELYNAVSGTNYTNPELLRINTLENAIYMSMYNDISFIIDSRLNLYEHQSTYCPNLPLRFLHYVSDVLSLETKDANLYGKKIVKIPTPKFLVFYNGEEKRPEIEVLKLSDSFIVPDEFGSLELKAVILNINPGNNVNLLDTCKTLSDYSEYTHRVRKFAKEMGIDDAVEKAIIECIRDGILEEFLRKNKAEAKKVSIYEYDQEKHMQQERESSWQDGHAEGLTKGVEVGEKQKILELVRKKVAKRKTVAQIAEELEETEETIKKLMEEISSDMI